MAEAPGHLRRGVLGLGDALAESLAVLSLALGVAFGSSVAAGDTGITVPLAYAIAGVGSLCLASVFVRFTRRMASAGGLYTYISRGLSPEAGFIGGWLYAGAFAVGISFVVVIAAFFTALAVGAHTGLDLTWYQWLFPLLALLAVLAVFDIRVSTRVQLVVAGAGVLAITGLGVAIAAQGGDDGLSAAPLDPSRVPSASGLFLAVVLGFTGFIGFEAAAVLGEEARTPLRAIPRAILSATLVALVYYVFVTWAMAIGFGVDHADRWAADPAALDTLATRYVGAWLATVIDFAVAAGALVGALGALQLTARTLYAMGRDGALPRAFARTTRRFGTPWVALGTLLVLTLLLAALLARHYGPLTYFALIATTSTLAILATYILVAVSGLVFFLRRRVRTGVPFSLVLDAVLPAAAIAICGYTIWKSIVPQPPSPVDLAPWIAGGWLVLGLAAVAYLRARRPALVAGFGATLGLDEAPERAPG